MRGEASGTRTTPKKFRQLKAAGKAMKLKLADLETREKELGDELKRLAEWGAQKIAGKRESQRQQRREGLGRRPGRDG